MPPSNSVTRLVTTLACLLGHVILGTSLYAQDNPPDKERVELRFREWFVSMDGTVRDKGHQGSGTRLDVDRDLGIDEMRPSPIVEIGIEVPSVGTFLLGYSGLHFRGEEVLPVDVLYDDQAFAAGTATETEFWLSTYALSYEYPLLRSSPGSTRVELGVGLGARLFSGQVDFRTASTDTHSALHRPLLLPLLHGGIDVTPWLRADARLGGMAYSTTKSAATYFEISAEATAHFWRGLYAGLGYQFVANEIEAKKGSANHNFDLDADFSGLYLVVGYNF